MPRIPLDRVEPGMQLSRHAKNSSGLMLLERGTTITEALIRKLRNAKVRHVFVGGAGDDAGMQEALAALEERFKLTRNEPHMNALKELLEEHMRDVLS
jgi:CTP:molybdopterin cytidylyltransferase MocA